MALSNASKQLLKDKKAQIKDSMDRVRTLIDDYNQRIASLQESRSLENKKIQDLGAQLSEINQDVAD